MRIKCLAKGLSQCHSEKNKNKNKQTKEKKQQQQQQQIVKRHASVISNQNMDKQRRKQKEVAGVEEKGCIFAQAIYLTAFMKFQGTF